MCGRPEGLRLAACECQGRSCELDAAKAKLKTEFPEARVFRFETMDEEMSSEVSERVFMMQVAMASPIILSLQVVQGVPRMFVLIDSKHG